MRPIGLSVSSCLRLVPALSIAVMVEARPVFAVPVGPISSSHQTVRLL